MDKTSRVINFEGFEGSEVILPKNIIWSCPHCGEISDDKGGSYVTSFVVRLDKRKRVIFILLKGECGKCGEKDDPPAPYAP